MAMKWDNAYIQIVFTARQEHNYTSRPVLMKASARIHRVCMVRTVSLKVRSLSYRNTFKLHSDLLDCSLNW
jgi:hypothetical protein